MIKVIAPSFDAVLVVDWSAAASPKRGADSIWWAEVRHGRRGPRVVASGNPPTRTEALAILTVRLQRLLARQKRCLIGFDFPNGYPAGFARAAGFAKPDEAPWRATWRGLSAMIEDRPDNGNNRFQVAGELNRRISGADHPFWGLPVNAREAHIKAKKPQPAAGRKCLNQRRICEAWVPRAKTVWQLCYTGSVGSQSLMGIPVLAALRFQNPFAEQTRIWPFETGLALPAAAARIVVAEIYPSLNPLGRIGGSVKDEAQVKASALFFARRDCAGDLPSDFAGPPELTARQRRQISTEESWILGAGTAVRPKIIPASV